MLAPHILPWLAGSSLELVMILGSGGGVYLIKIRIPLYVKSLYDIPPIVSISSTPSNLFPLVFDGKSHQIHAAGLLSVQPVCTGRCPDGLLPVLKLYLIHETPHSPYPVPGAFIVLRVHLNYCLYRDISYLCLPALAS